MSAAVIRAERNMVIYQGVRTSTSREAVIMSKGKTRVSQQTIYKVNANPAIRPASSAVVFTTRPLLSAPPVPPPIHPHMMWNPNDLTPIIRAFTKNHPIRRSRSSSDSDPDIPKMPKLQKVKHIICPHREEPFRPGGSAGAGENISHATSSSIFPFPLKHTLGQKGDDDMANAMERDARKRARLGVDGTPGVSPLLSLRAPGLHGASTSISIMRVIARPSLPRRPNLLCGSAQILRWEESQRKAGKVAMVKGNSEIDEGGRFPRQRVLRAATNRASRITTRRIGITNWEARLGFLRRGRELGETSERDK